jgi:hypothetical protein
MPLSELGRRLRKQTPQGRLSKWEISLKDISDPRNTVNQIASWIKNSRIRLSQKHMQIIIHKLRDREQVVSQPIHKSGIIQGTKQLTFLIIPKSHILLMWQGVRLKNHFLFPIMCHEQPESMSHLSFKALSSIYMGREEVDDSVLG